MDLSPILKTAVRVAKKSTHDKARIGAVAMRGHAIVAIGCNRTSKKSPDFAAHAERIALSDAGYAADSMAVARVGKDGTILDSLPCPACLTLLKTCGVKGLEYVQNGGRRVLKLAY